jgi:hypothetical protein
MMRGQAAPASLRPCSPKARGHPSDRRSGLQPTQTQAALAQVPVWGNAIRQQPKQIRSLTGPHWGHRANLAFNLPCHLGQGRRQ